VTFVRPADTRSEQFQTRQGMRAAQRLAALGEMTAGVAHDFRNLLAVIESGLSLAEKNSEHPDKVRTYIASARAGIERGAELTSQLLALAQQRGFEPRAANVNELLRRFEPFLSCGAGSGIRIILELAPDLPKCLVDPSQFDAAILNLVINARDAMPNGGEVRVSTKPLFVKTKNDGPLAPGVYVCVRIKDSGQGMSTDVARKVFEPFFTTKGENGTGIGLPHVYTFVRLMGGHVRVASERGIGTTFDLFFPSVDGTGNVYDAAKALARWETEGGAPPSSCDAENRPT